MSHSNTRSLSLPLPRLSRPAVMLLATLAVAVLAGTAQTAFAQPMGPHDGMGHRMGGMGEKGHRMGGMGDNGHRMGGGGGLMTGRALDLVNATAEQRTQIKTIMDTARTDMKASHDSARSLHQQMQAAFAATTVDARVVENLRAQISALRDTQSKRMTQAMIDASRVLTPEQRKTLADAAAKRHTLMQRHAAERAALDKPAATK
jgi:periplasmic protein CpxP/Spy